MAAKGLRNTQSLWLDEESAETFRVFADTGRVTAGRLRNAGLGRKFDLGRDARKYDYENASVGGGQIGSLHWSTMPGAGLPIR